MFFEIGFFFLAFGDIYICLLVNPMYQEFDVFCVF